MKILPIILAGLFLGNLIQVNAATDWTQYLKPMLSGCGYVNLPDTLSPRYDSSIISILNVIKKERYNLETEDIVEHTTYTLNNSMAFGKPLLKIEFQVGYEWHQLDLYFKDDKFTTLRPQFKLPKGDIDIQEDSASGYVVGRGGTVELIFDKKQKSITCHEYV